LKYIEQPSSRRKRRHYRTARGGSRLNRLKSGLVGDQNRVDALAPDHPRRRPTLPVLHFLDEEEVS
jgi:hypothetical protein